MELRSGRLVGVGGYSWSGSQLAYHPLMNNEILRNLFTHFTIDECKTLRLVNTLWLQELQKRWVNEAVVGITLAQRRQRPGNRYYNNETYFGLLNFNYQLNSMSIKDFLNESTSPFPGGCLLNGKPIRNLRIGGQCVEDIEISLGNPSAPISKFWSIFGTSLKYLELDEVKFTSSEDTRKLLFELTPNLETLIFTSYGCEFYFNEDEPTNFQPPPVVQLNLKLVSIELANRKFPISWMEFFSHFLNIQEFKLTLDPQKPMHLYLNTIFDALITIRHAMRNGVLNLTHLTLNDYTRESWRFDDRLATKLCSLQLPLSQLGFRWMSVDKEVMTRVIQSHRGTLKTLYVEVERLERFLYNFPYEILPENLTKLKLGGRVFPTWKFLKFTPNLRTLHVVQITGERNFLKVCVEFRREQIPVLNHLTELYYITMDVVPGRTVKFLVKAMPNVTNLNMSADAVGFKQICQNWKLREWSSERCVVQEDVFVKHITLLNSLSKLGVWECPDPGFGEVAIHEGFLKLRNLSELKARLSCQVSESSISLLISQVRNVFIRRCGDAR